MKLIIHGAGKEVGRSCLELSDSNFRILLDCGIKLTPDGVEHPIEIENVDKIDAVFLSHAHLDHTGHLPVLDYLGYKGPIIATPATRAITKILLEDSYGIEMAEHSHPAYQKSDVERIAQSINIVNYNQENKLKSIKYKFIDAGHIPGSAAILFEIDGKRIIYTGDINTDETRLLKGADLNYGNVDVLITESTYGDRLHPNREQTEKEFLDLVQERIKKGPVLLPCFAVGRAQEIALLLAKRNITYPIYIDGLAKRVTHSFYDFPSELKDVKELREAFKKIKEVHGNRERDNIIKERFIVITTSGMMDGGPIIDYLQHFRSEPDASVILTGYQAEGSSGRLMMESDKIRLEGTIYGIKCFKKQFDFSAHAGQDGLKKIIAAAKPKKIIIVHGDPAAAVELGNYAKSLGIETKIPKIGEKITI